MVIPQRNKSLVISKFYNIDPEFFLSMMNPQVNPSNQRMRVISLKRVFEAIPKA